MLSLKTSSTNTTFSSLNYPTQNGTTQSDRDHALVLELVSRKPRYATRKSFLCEDRLVLFQGHRQILATLCMNHFAPRVYYQLVLHQEMLVQSLLQRKKEIEKGTTTIYSTQRMLPTNERGKRRRKKKKRRAGDQT